MKVLVRLCIFLSTIIVLAACSEQAKEGKLFERLDSAKTHVDFVNRVEEEFKGLTVLDYLYYYNGGGVASGDFNNDGLQDLFFVSNHQSNKLYLNRGNLQFDDITITAGVGGFSQWKTGVSIVDINGDGWLDIYVCALGNFKGIEGSNELYINNGDNTFTEKSADMGLDFSGMATQSLFFDYDHDGDLDMYLVTHAPHTARSYDRVMASMLTDKVASDRLYRNDNGLFTDVTEAARIDHEKISYGMSATIADINNDGWEDIYVANDFYEEDACYINQRDGTFVDQGRTLFDFGSRYAHGADIADINNDGYEDIMTVDIRSDDPVMERQMQADDAWEQFNFKKVYNYPLQFSRNVLQMNDQGQGFSEVGAQMGVDASGWTWSVLLADFNNDGRKDIFTTNGIPRGLNHVDYLEYAHKDSIRYALELSKTHIRRALDKMPVLKEHNHIFENQGTAFADQSVAWGFNDTGFSDGAVYTDLDNDGDLDIVTNNMNDGAGFYINKINDVYPEHHSLAVKLVGSNKNTAGVGAKVFVKTSIGFQLQHVTSSHGFLSSAIGKLVFGLGTNSHADSVFVLWNDQSYQVFAKADAGKVLLVEQKNALQGKIPLSIYHVDAPLLKENAAVIDVPFVHKENEYFEFYREPLIPFLSSREGPALAVGDINGDGLDDFFVGGAKHQSGSVYIQRMTGNFQKLSQPAPENDKIYEDVDALWVDVDGDKDLDLYVVSGGNEFFDKMDRQFDRLYRNDGKGNLTRDELALPPMYQNKGCVRAADLDSDGDVDLFVGGRVVPFHYGAPAGSFILINDGHGKFSDQTMFVNPDLKSIGMVTDAQWGDLDKDGDLDLVVVGEWMPLSIFINNNGKLVLSSDWMEESTSEKNVSGLWQCVTLGDFDNDGDLDIVAGNLGLNTMLQRGGLAALRLYADVSTSEIKPVPVMARKEANGKYYPLVQWAEWQKLLGEKFTQKFPTAASYALADVDELKEKLDLSWKEMHDVDQLASVYLENSGNAKFSMSLLPDAAQRSAIFAMVEDDVNGDDNPDLLTGGNNANVAPVQGAYLANKGLVLIGNGKGMLQPVSPQRSGVYMRSDVRVIRPFQSKDKVGYLYGINNDTLRLYYGKK